jgi:ABC-type lipoprotein export system ATPase subunit
VNIKIADFLSLKNVEFEIEKGITVIAGKNGSGKSQLLIGIAHNNSKQNLMEEYGYSSKYNYKEIPQIQIDTPPKLVLYRPPVRRIAENGRSSEYAGFSSITSIIQAENKQGYSLNVENRFLSTYSIIANFFVTGNLKTATQTQMDNWELLANCFYEVFSKKLLSAPDLANGIKVGIELSPGNITSFNALSTGELEFISLLLDLILEHDIPTVDPTDPAQVDPSKKQKADMILVDELDAHFHPDLQKKIINTISDLCKDKYVILTTHSPSVMLSIDSSHLFFLEKNIDCEEKDAKGNIISCKNQISRLSDDSQLYAKIADMYKGFTVDLNFATQLSDANNYQIQKFADDCLKDSIALAATPGKESDPQIMVLHTAILMTPNPIILEVGCGKGRTLSMLSSLDDTKLSTITYVGADIKPENLKEIEEYANSIGLPGKLLKFSAVDNPVGVNADLCIFANVLHELSPLDMAGILNQYFHLVKENAQVFILEVLQLAVGEKDFVMFCPDAITKLCSKQLSENKIEICGISTPKSHNQTPLMNVVIKVLKPLEVNFVKEDIVEALKVIVDIETGKLIKHHDKSSIMSGLKFAFATHNLANAMMYLRLLQGGC